MPVCSDAATRLIMIADSDLSGEDINSLIREYSSAGKRQSDRLLFSIYNDRVAYITSARKRNRIDYKLHNVFSQYVFEYIWYCISKPSFAKHENPVELLNSHINAFAKNFSSYQKFILSSHHTNLFHFKPAAQTSRFKSGEWVDEVLVNKDFIEYVVDEDEESNENDLENLKKLHSVLQKFPAIKREKILDYYKNDNGARADSGMLNDSLKKLRQAFGVEESVKVSIKELRSLKFKSRADAVRKLLLDNIDENGRQKMSFGEIARIAGTGQSKVSMVAKTLGLGKSKDDLDRDAKAKVNEVEKLLKINPNTPIKQIVNAVNVSKTHAIRIRKKILERVF